MRLRSGSTWIALVLLGNAILLGSVLVGCEGLGGGDGNGGSSSDTTVSVTAGPTTSTMAVTTTAGAPTTTTEAPTPSTTPTTLAITEEKLPNGNIKSMVYVDDVWVDGTGRHMRIDQYCEFVYGADATAAARADGEIGPTEEWDLDFYIARYPAGVERRVSNPVAITTSTRWAPHDGDGAPCSWADFLTFWGPGSLPDGDSHLHAVPWWIERDGNTVVKIYEQYLP